MSDAPTPPHATYLELLTLLAEDNSVRSGAQALRSLDVLDAKAQGVSGVIGGFAAGITFFAADGSIRYPGPLEGEVALLLAVAALFTSALLCASVLYVLGPHSSFLLEDLPKTPPERVEVATARLMAVYGQRVKRYRLALYLLFIGVAFLACALILAFLPGGH